MPPKASSGAPSHAEIQTAADIIRRLPRGFLPYPLFMAITAKIVTPTLELAVFKEENEALEILLTRRPDDDEHWPSQWHVPGTVIRSTDNEGSYETCFERIVRDELRDLVAIDTPEWISIEFWEMERGRELDQLHYATLLRASDLPNDMQFFPVDNLPSDLMRHHRDMIATIAKAYQTRRSDG